MDSTSEIPLEQDISQTEIVCLASLLEQIGLVASTNNKPDTDPETQREQKESTASEGSETPLGSLHRTNMTLGEPDKTTDTEEFINKEWGIQGTMVKIFRLLIDKAPHITVDSLLQKGPVLELHRRIIAVRCFSSILKLQSHGFINVIKDKNTFEMSHIELGPRFTEKVIDNNIMSMT